MVKNMPASAGYTETWVQSPSQENLLEKEMATHSSILAWKIPWTEESGGLQSMESQTVRHNRAAGMAQQRPYRELSPKDESQCTIGKDIKWSASK